MCGFPENETILHVCCVFVPTAYRRDISCWNISFFLPLFPYTKPSPRSFKPIQTLDLFQAVSYDSRGVFGGKNIIKKILKTGKRKTGVCIYIYDPVGTNSVDRPFNVPTAYSGWKTKTSTIIQAKRNKWKIIVKNGTFLHPTIFFNLYIMPTHVSVDKRKMYTKDKQNIIYKGGDRHTSPQKIPSFRNVS